MNRTLRLAALPLVVATSLGSSSCVDNTQSVYISSFLAIRESLNCGVTADQTDYAVAGLVDTAVLDKLTTASGYVVAPLLKNAMVSTGTTTTPERNSIIPRALEIEFRPSTGQTLPPVPGIGDKFSASFAYPSVEPGGVGFGKLEILTRNQALRLAPFVGQNGWDGVLVARMRFAYDHNGQLEYTATRDFPIALAANSLSQDILPCPPGGIDTALIQKACIPGQDERVTCCTQGVNIACGDQVPVRTATGDGGI